MLEVEKNSMRPLVMLDVATDAYEPKLFKRDMASIKQNERKIVTDAYDVRCCDSCL